MKKQIFLFVSFLITLCACTVSIAQKNERPNVVIIFADDIGYSDIGCYGSEIETPNIDMLANNGLRFRNFYNGAKCEPTRNSLFTGLYTGDDRAMSFEGVLRDNGYSVIHSGKEHFESWVPERCFAANASDHAFTFWAADNFFIPVDSVFNQPLFIDGKKVEPRDLEKINNKKPFYMTDFITDMGLKWLDEVVDKEDPFLLVLPYNAAHWPLQAFPEDIAKYRDVYRKGWDQIRAERFEKMKKLGVIPDGIELSDPEPDPTLKKSPFTPRNDGFDEYRRLMTIYTPWDELSEEMQEKFSLEEAVYAAMIDRMDQNIGRVMQKLEKEGVADNTIVMFFSDNGACPFERNRGLEPLPGGRDGWRTQSTAWANVGNTPFRLYKQNGHEGGAKNHFIVSWPTIIQPGTFTDELTHVVDIFPTLLDVGNIEYPKVVDGEPSIPLHGSSLLSVFDGQDREDPPFIISGYSEQKRMFLKGDFKLVRSVGEWELYHLKQDPAEMHDLAKAKPELVQEMIKAYEETKAMLNAGLKPEKRPVNYPFRKPVKPGYDEMFYNQYNPIKTTKN